MLRSMIASKTTKLVAACVCPVAGTGALTVAVPQVRSAVHKATAPRAYAAPKARVRPASTAPCPEVAPVVVNAPLALAPAQINPQAPASASASSASNPTRLAESRPRPSVPGDIGGVVPGGGGGGEDGPDNPVAPPTPPVPEPATWAQMIVGFGLIGGVVRASHVRGGVADA